MEARFLPSAAVAALGALLADGAYLLLIASEEQGQLGSARVLFVAGSIGGAALVLAWAAWARPSLLGAGLLGAAAGTLFVWMMLGAMSIGILLVPATVLAVVAASRSPLTLAWVGAGGAVVLAVLGLGVT
jgi:hypothetical protein